MARCSQEKYGSVGDDNEKPSWILAQKRPCQVRQKHFHVDRSASPSTRLSCKRLFFRRLKNIGSGNGSDSVTVDIEYNHGICARSRDSQSMDSQWPIPLHPWLCTDSSSTACPQQRQGRTRHWRRHAHTMQKCRLRQPPPTRIHHVYRWLRHTP